MKLFRGTVFLVMFMACPLSAQQTETERFNEIKAKAEAGDAVAEFNLGSCYAVGQGVSQDLEEAAKWFRKAAEAGNPEGQCSLGVYYHLHGNPSEAVLWYRKAAEQGYPRAQWMLGSCYANGLGLEKDDTEAVKWFRKAAEQGEAGGQWNLGWCYSKGKGVPQNDIKAYTWMSLAVANGMPEGAKVRDEVTHRMSRAEIAEGQREAAMFVAHKESSTQSPSTPAGPGRLKATGTGFFITDDGYLISNHHVVETATKIRLLTSHGQLDAKIIRVDAANDLALLKVSGRFAALPVSSSSSVALGRTVATVGFPDPELQGFSPKLAKGEIAGLAGAGDNADYFQISVPVQPGNSGGALVDERGNVVGIVSAKLNAAVALASSGALPENVNYAIKSSFLLSFLESVPEVARRMGAPNTKEERFEEVVKSAESAAALVLVY